MSPGKDLPKEIWVILDHHEIEWSLSQNLWALSCSAHLLIHSTNGARSDGHSSGFVSHYWSLHEHPILFVLFCWVFFFSIRTEISKLEHSFHMGQPNFLYFYFFNFALFFGLVGHVVIGTYWQMWKHDFKLNWGQLSQKIIEDCAQTLHIHRHLLYLHSPSLQEALINHFLCLELANLKTITYFTRNILFSIAARLVASPVSFVSL